jgi:photosystem II stability/assembly factor-like uncharacterized protein
MKTLLRRGFVLGSLLLSVQPVLAQTWTQTSAPETSWSSIACSADGTRLVASTYYSGIWISTNSGAGWTMTGASQANDWWAVASSADGTRLAAVDSYYGAIGISEDSGTTWTAANVPKSAWHNIAISADGTKLAASANGCIYTSTDSGMSWVSNRVPAFSTSALLVASSADSSKLVVAVNYPGQIFTSTNMGANWELAYLPFPGVALYSIASSADGSTWLAGGGTLGGSGIFVTTNSGATWISNSVPSLGPVTWSSCASSADGSTLLAVATSYNLDLKNAGLIFTSTNFGITWSQTDAPEQAWTAVASSADGCLMAGSAANWPIVLPAYPGNIYTAQITPALRMNITPANGNLKPSWIVPSTHFVLQENSDLTTANWTDVTNTPVLNLTNLQEEVTLPATNGSGFYRLATQ